MSESNSDRSISGWWAMLKAGQTEAADELWNRYFGRMVRSARQRFPSGARRESDEEDAALSAFHSLCRGAMAGRFDVVQNRDDLWRLLVAITNRKVVDQIRRSTATKRGAGDVMGESAFINPTNTEMNGINNAIGDDPSPEFLAAVDDQLQHLLRLLRDESLRQICQLRMQGYSNDEIAGRMGITTRSVERKLQLIRDKWSKEME